MKIFSICFSVLQFFDFWLTKIGIENTTLDEGNGIGRWLLHNWGIYGLLYAKIASTFLVLTCIYFLSKTSVKHASIMKTFSFMGIGFVVALNAYLLLRIY